MFPSKSYPENGVPRASVDHLAILRTEAREHADHLEGSVIRAIGRYYTHPSVGKYLVESIWRQLRDQVHIGAGLSVVDPFAGDGRLVTWLIERFLEQGRNDVSWTVQLWDVEPKPLARASQSLRGLAERAGIQVDVSTLVVDTFRHGSAFFNRHDVVITNPPWELLKPDRRELRLLGGRKGEYIAAMREYDRYLGDVFPLSQPARKFAGWGTNLARAGAEVALKLACRGGVVGIVSPASLLADDMSVALRRWLLLESTLEDVAFFPAEMRLFGDADVSTAALVLRRIPAQEISPRITLFRGEGTAGSSTRVAFPRGFLDSNGYVIPISFGAHGIRMLMQFSDFSTLGSLESDRPDGLWAGREVDETGITKWLATEGDGLFVKGRMVERFAIVEEPKLWVRKKGWRLPQSVAFSRIAWRDVSRPSQKRRVKATIIPPGWIAGNSLGVAHFYDGDETRLRALLGLMSSLPFEFQLRSLLATGHVSLGALRKVRVPWLTASPALCSLAEAVDHTLMGREGGRARVEAIVANMFGLSESEFRQIVDEFPGFAEAEKEQLIGDVERARKETLRTRGARTLSVEERSVGKALSIPNHRTAKLSALDMTIAVAVPPGGNWKDVPESVPSKRLETIRISYREGKGSRSTYYGRLRADKPAYTINTYFSRPGNGCHLHYDYEGGQHRVLSQREAARLQSFPDSFAFHGSQASINKQIGNAVPPLLAFHVARELGTPGLFVDLFSGAGGLGLGFIWAGWRPIVGTDIEPSFLDTYRANVHPQTVSGDIRDPSIFKELVHHSAVAREKGSPPVWVLGGPPCQGFSTAGKPRTMDDERNHLFWNYKHFLDVVKPDGFVFENVTGLLNMEGGRTFKAILDVLSQTDLHVNYWVLSAEEYAIPQRRTRVFIVGRRGEGISEPQERLTSMKAGGDLFGATRPAVSVEAALGDLPPLREGQDGSRLGYRSDPRTEYQALMRGQMTPEAYLDGMRQVG